MKSLVLLLLLFACQPANAQNPVVNPTFPTTGIVASSGNVAAAPAVATLPAIQGRFTYICGFSITSAGSTGAADVVATVTGLNGGTLSFSYETVAGANAANLPLVIPFTPCMPSSTVNTAVVVTLPSLGTGNTTATVNAWGYQ